MDMSPATDTLEKCKKRCDDNPTCNAIEYSEKTVEPNKVNCCYTFACPAEELEPTLDKTDGHQGDVYDSYIKGKDELL